MTLHPGAEMFFAHCLRVLANHVRFVPWSLPPLRAAMNDPDPKVRAAAAKMVTRLTGEEAGSTPPE